MSKRLLSHIHYWLGVGFFAFSFMSQAASFTAIEKESADELQAGYALIQDLAGEGIFQQRLGYLHNGTYDFAQNEESAEIIFELFDGLVATVKVTDVKSDEGSITIIGLVDNQPGANFVLNKTGDAISGVMYFSDGTQVDINSYSDTEGLVLVRELDPAAALPCGLTDDIVIPFAATALDDNSEQGIMFSEQTATQLGGTTEIDVLVVVSDDTYADVGSDMNIIRSKFRTALTLSNTRFQNSNIDLVLNDIAYRTLNIPTDYRSSSLLLNDFKDNYNMDSVLDSEEADLVVLVSSTTSLPNSAGIATKYELGFDKYDAVFAVVPIDQFDWALTHEVGHMLGCTHNRADANTNSSFNYGYGYRDSSYITQMAYQSATGFETRLNYFSSPNIIYAGRVLGDAFTDNSRVIRNTMATIAGFRTPRIITSVNIVGKNPIYQNSSEQYQLKVNYNFGSPDYYQYSPTWSEDSVYATISSGLLQVGPVPTKQEITLTATYLGFTASGLVTVFAQDKPVKLTSLEIRGADVITERTRKTYRLYATFDDGSQRNVSDKARWINRPGYISLGKTGSAYAKAVPYNKRGFVSAAYSYDGKVYKAYKSIVIRDRRQGANAPAVVSNNEVVSYLSAGYLGENKFKISVPKGTKRLIIRSYGGTGNASIYLRHRSIPSLYFYDYRANSSLGNKEVLIIRNPRVGNWYFTANTITGYSTVTVKATLLR